MERREFNISINAPKEKVWKVLWDDSTYPKWTSVFTEGISEEPSRAETDWNKGSKVLFTDGKGNGMVSTIADKIPNEFMSFRHLGEVKDGVEDVTSEKVQAWAGAHENYTLKGKGTNTELKVEMDIADDYMDYFEKTFPRALAKVKELAEKN